MTKSNKNILGLSFIILIFGVLYMFKDALRILIIQKQAINNYRNTSIYFDSLSTFISNDIFYSIELLEDEFISIEISNVDRNLVDSILESNYFDSRKRLDSLKLFKLNQIGCEELPLLRNKLLLQNEVTFKDWRIRYLGLISDLLLKKQFQNLGINYDHFLT